MTQESMTTGNEAPAEGPADLPPPTGESPQPADASADDGREQRIRERAYALWEAEGRPAGREADHWRQAEQDEQGGSQRETVAETTGYVPQPQDAPTEQLPTVHEPEPEAQRKGSG